MGLVLYSMTNRFDNPALIKLAVWLLERDYAIGVPQRTKDEYFIEAEDIVKLTRAHKGPGDGTVDIEDLKSSGESLAGSNPAPGTKIWFCPHCNPCTHNSNEKCRERRTIPRGN